MKVLFVTCWYPHQGFPNRGIFVHEHAKAVARQGGEVKVFHLWVEENSAIWKVEERKFVKDDVEVFSVVIHSRFQRFIYGNTPLMRALGRYYYKSRIAQVFSPDIIHGNVIYQAGIIAEKLAIPALKPFVISEHWSKLDWYFGRKILSYQAKKVYEKASAVLPVSDILKENIQKHLDQKDHLITIPNVVDTELFFYEEKTSDDLPVDLLMVMNYQNSQKRPEMLLQALSRLPGELHQKFRLTMIGRGNNKVETKAYWDELGLQSEIRFTGELAKEKVAEAMRGADYFVQPTNMETFGVTVAEALCSGLPCLVSNAGALPELVDKKSGVLLENRVDDWVKALKDILEEKYHFDRQKIANRYKDKFSYEMVGKQFLEVYDDVLN
ncbi:glycosyltransferase [Aliifodinibius sp. S!AR15-10]|uniref:glycosyltransferase n=1 Tax=Aliifodinibius sp. S!AR15-10 TaxID=2950437 RepID=UPI002861F7C4|nr:glycosyltransferase [Aliifodinibius sp. S!AR15-10]MDR8394068.1 glycosyltransferase [Aliifodinibius sp. S!AR15-10]